MTPHVVALAALTCSCLLSSAAGAQVPTVPVGAQPETRSMVKTMRDKVLVWRRNPSAVIATLPEGVVLEAIAREAQWYQVRVPEKFAGAGGAIGFVYAGHVELIEGPEPPLRAPLPPASQTSHGPRQKGVPPPAFGARGRPLI